MRRRRWQIVLPVVGLLLFGFFTTACIVRNHQIKSSKYFWWGGLGLERRPLEIEPHFRTDDGAESVGWDPGHIWIEQSPIQELIVLSGFPAFLALIPIFSLSRMFGLDQLYVFLAAAPILLTCWYWFVGWLIDHGWMTRPLWHRQPTT